MAKNYAVNGVSVESKEERLPHQKMNLSYTATGYGRRIPSTFMVKFKNRWRRVYVAIYSNAGTAYIGKLEERLFVDEA
jgi:hypothetical protein|tara:strand:+ start:400 stop:633 length:234 start_codon:yes stop_codon:yes gene_type:complete